MNNKLLLTKPNTISKTFATVVPKQKLMTENFTYIISKECILTNDVQVQSKRYLPRNPLLDMLKKKLRRALKERKALKQNEMAGFICFWPNTVSSKCQKQMKLICTLSLISNDTYFRFYIIYQNKRLHSIILIFMLTFQYSISSCKRFLMYFPKMGFRLSFLFFN